MYTMREAIEIVIIILSLTAAILTIVASKTNNEKVKKAAKITEEMKKLCMEAEAVNPNNKKDYVLFGIKKLCEKLNFQYNEEYWSNAIDSLIAITKKINYKR